MREEEQAKRNTKFSERKPLPKIYRTSAYIVAAVLLILTFVTRSDFILLLFFTVIATVVNYETNMTTIRFNPQPEVFASLVLAKLIGFQFSFVMLILPTILVDIYTARLDPDTFISLILTVIICFLMSKFMIFSFLVFALILVTAKFIIGAAINLGLDLSMEELLFEHVFGFVTNVVLLLAFGDFFVNSFH